ncbi:MAG TPA: galactose oxidase-like domain-containing protein [Thermoanaerobaculia bacterium]
MLVLLAAAGAASAQSHEDYFEADFHRHGIRERTRSAPPPRPDETGSWKTLHVLMPINPVHMALMHNGKVLVIAGSGSTRDPANLHAAVYDPVAQNVSTISLEYDMFCNGMVILPDGRPFVMGGTEKYSPPMWRGLPETSAFSPSSGTFTRTATMTGGRWYPTGTLLSDGTVMVISGLTDSQSAEQGTGLGKVFNEKVQIYDPRTDRWTEACDTCDAFPKMKTLYPRQTLLPTGQVFVSGAEPRSWFFDPKTFKWHEGPKTNYGLPRNYGTSVLLPLTPANEFTPTVMILGGGPDKSIITNKTETINLALAQPKWTEGPPMLAPRMDLNATILPNGQVLVSGGSSIGEQDDKAVLQSEIYDPVAKTLTPAASMEYPRLYHSNTLLLPDGTVLAAGSNPVFPEFEPHMEVYSPAYLFNSDGSPATRPVITSVTGLAYGISFPITTPDAASIASVVLIRPGAPTHAFDMEQRMVGLEFTVDGGVLNAAAPKNGKLAPPGYYLLFIVNKAGVPSVARFVLLK